MEGGGVNMAMEVIEEEEMVVGGQPPPPPPMPPPEQQMTRITTCEKHPDVPVIGLCALCLRDRLVDLEVSRSNNNADSSSSSATTTASAKLKSIFFRISSSSNNNSSINQQQQPPPLPQQHSRQQRQRSSGGSSTLLPQLRRCRSFSAGRLDGSYATPRASTSLEPQRKSCDVRGRNTLWSLFHQDDVKGHQLLPPATGRGDGKDVDTDRSRNVGFPPGAPVMESKEDEDEDEEEDEEEDEFEDAIGGKDSTRCHSQEEREEEVDVDHRLNDDGIGFAVDDDDNSKEVVQQQQEEEKSVAQVVEEEEDGGYETRMKVKTREEEEEEATTSTKKAPSKDLKEIAGSFWLAASVFSKKLRKWRQKQKLKKQQNSNNRKQDHSHHNPHQDYNNIYCSSTTSSSSLSYKLPSSSSSLRQPRGSLDMLLPPSEDLVALGRRSCDVIAPPRFSLDTGRISLDDPWDEPRASWDGYLLSGGGGAGRSHNFLNPPNSGVAVQRSDGLIPVEEDHFPNIPGGALQARDYYADFNRRGGGGGGGGGGPRRSLDRSNSMLRRGGPSSEDNINGGGSARVSFELGAAPNDSSFHYSSTSLRGDDWSESFDSTTHTGRDPTTTIREEHRTPQPKKLRRRWSKAWNLWGFIHRGGRGNNHGQRNVVGRSMSETWVDHRGGRMLRSSSSSSGLWGLSSCDGNGNGNGFGNGSKKKKRTRGSGGFVQMERNRSTRYSQLNNSFESNGMPRFYLPPMRSGGRHGGTRRSVRESLGNPNAFPRSVLQLY